MNLPPQRYFTPLRYPGGKAKIAPFFRALIESNSLADGEYVEPYCGGAGIALDLLFHEYVSRVHLNDVDRMVNLFWNVVLADTESLCRRIRDTKLSVTTWKRQREIIRNPAGKSEIDCAFAFLLLNRTNRSGIIRGGVIGGLDQSGPWKIDARFNGPELIRRIKKIARYRERIVVTCTDAMKFLKISQRTFGEKALVYLDPPYFQSGRRLYTNSYDKTDHAHLAKMVLKRLRRNWVVSYDNVAEILRLYRGVRRRVYSLSYSAAEKKRGNEVMFFSADLTIPKNYPLFSPVP